MKNRFTVACIGVAAAGLAVFTAFKWHNDGASMYRPTAQTKLEAGEDRDKEDAAGAADWWFHRMKNPATGQLDYDAMMLMQQRSGQVISNASAMRSGNPAASVQSTSWTELGPDNIGGRTRAILFDNMDATHMHMFAGGVTGGLWESTDGANNWHRCVGFFSTANSNNICINTIAQAPNGDLYVGGGEGNFAGLYGFPGGSSTGGGIYKSTDLGVSWTLLSSTVPTSQNSVTAAWIGVNKIAVDPNNPNHIYAATNKGFKVSTDGGSTWNTPTGMSASAVSTDVQVNADYVVAIVSAKPWVSHDAGNTFTATGSATNGFTNSSLSRTTVAIAPSNKNYVYALCAASGTATGQLAGMYVSIDGGMNWTMVTGAGNSQFDPFGSNAQGNYDNIIAVDPQDAGRAVVGGTALYEWRMVTTSPVAGQWNQIALEFPASAFNPFYVHSDKHEIVFHPTLPGVFYIGTDGGIFRTVNNGNTYEAMNSGYNVTQCYSIAWDNTAGLKNLALGGCQDNGTVYVDGTGNTPMWANEISGGDGGWCTTSFLNPYGVFSTIYYGQLFRSNNRGNSMSQFYDTRITGLAGFGQPGFASFVTPIALWESGNDLLSGDSIIVASVQYAQNKHVTDGVTATFTGTLSITSPVANPAGTIVLDSVMFVAGSDTVVSDAAGNLSGDGTGTVNTNGSYTVTFNTTPPSNRVVKAYFYLTYGVGTVFTVNSNVSGRTIDSNPLTTTLGPGDTLKVQDVYQSHLAVGFTGDKGIWLCRRAVDFAAAPDWFKIGGTHSTPDSYGGEAECLTWSPDGNTLYVGTGGGSATGSLYRFDNVGMVVDSANGDVDNAANANPNTVVTCTRIANFGSSRSITSIDVDPNNPDHIVVTLGNYGQTAYVYYCANATTAPSAGNTSNFVNKTGNLESALGMVPTWSASFDKYQPNRVLVGTDHGIAEIANITSSSTWTASMTGLDNVPVMMIRQQRWDPWLVPNSGCFYIGTFGRGMWRDDSSWQQPTGISGPSQPYSGNSFVSNHDLRIFPNPVIDHSNVIFALDKPGDATVDIYDLNGKHVYSKNYEQLGAGVNTVQFEANDMVKGTYLIVVSQGTKRIGTGRFIKMD